MVTMVGNEDNIKDLITNLIYLEHDAIAAYDSCIERLDVFKNDHLQHLDILRQIATETGAEAPAEGDMKQMLTTGKIVLADLMGDAAALKAMKTNGDDTVTAYERALRHPNAMPQSKAFFIQACQDELRHRESMEATAKSL